MTTAEGSNLLAVAQALFAVGRFVASIMMKWVRPRFILVGFLSGCIVFISAAIPTRGNASIAMLCMVLFFEVSYNSLFSQEPISSHNCKAIKNIKLTERSPAYSQQFLPFPFVVSVATPSAVHPFLSPPYPAVLSSLPWSALSLTHETLIQLWPCRLRAS